MMLLTIALILVATVAIAAFEVWLFWSVGEGADRRPQSKRLESMRQRRGATGG